VRTGTALFLAVGLVSAGAVNAAILKVDDSDPSAYQSIQGAWDAAANGDTIEVYPGLDGVYYESLRLYGGSDGSKNGITVIAKGEVELQGPTVPSRIEIANVQDFTLDGFDISFYDAGGWYSHGIWVGSGDPANPSKNVTLQNLVIHDTGGIMEVRDSTGGLQGEVHFLNCECYQNTYNDTGDAKGTWWYANECHMEGVYSHDHGGTLGHFQTSYGRASHCVIRNCRVSGGSQGIIVGSYDGAVDGGVSRGSVLIEGCTVSDIPQVPYAGQAISISMAEIDAVVRDCTVTNCGVGLQVSYDYDSGRFGPTGNTSPNIPFDGQLTVEDCTFTDCQWFGMMVSCGNASISNVDVTMASDPHSEVGVYCLWNYRKIVYNDNNPAHGVAYSYSHPANLSLTNVSVVGDYLETDLGVVAGAQTGASDGGQTMGNVVLDNIYVSDCLYHGIELRLAEANLTLTNAVAEFNWEMGLHAYYPDYDHHLYGPSGSLGLPIPEPGELTVSSSRFEANVRAGVWLQNPVVRLADVTASYNWWQGFFCGNTVWKEVYVNDDPNQGLIYRYAPPLDAVIERCVANDNSSQGFTSSGNNAGRLEYVDCVAENNGGTDEWSGDGFAASGCMELSYENCTSTNAGLLTMSVGCGFHVFNNILVEFRNCLAADTAAAGYWLERCVLAEVDHSATVRAGLRGGPDGVWLLSGGFEPPNPAPPGLRAVLTNFVVQDDRGDNGIWVEGAHSEEPLADAIIDVVIRNSVIADNQVDCGIWMQRNGVVHVSYTDSWNNLNGDVHIEDPASCFYHEGPGVIHGNPLLTDPANNDLSLQPGSPCIGTGDPRDLDSLETRADMGCIDYADDPYPAKLMRETTRARIWGYEMPALGHSEFGIPFVPTGSANPNDMITKNGQPYNVNNRVYMWDSVRKTFLLFPLDFETLEVGQGYLYLNYFGMRADQLDIEYAAVPVSIAGRVLIPEEGRSMIAIPNGQPLWQGDILVKNNGTGEIRTAVEDRAAADHWLNWNWVYWSFAGSTYDIVGLGNEDETVRPWYSYQLWAYQRDLTLIFPGG
jgi:hypothetical protein